MRINKHGLNLIKRFESYIRKLPNGNCVPYLDKLASKKYWTPGYNGLLTQGWGSTGKNVQTLNQEWTPKQAERELLREIRVHETAVAGLLKVKVNQNQFSALVSLSYNMGSGNLARSSLLRVLNEGNYREAQRRFHRYNKAGGKVYRGLVRRRAAEANLFALPSDDVLVEKSTKLSMLRRIRLFIVAALPATAFTWENLASAREFAMAQGGWILLGIGTAGWIVLKWVETKSLADVADRRYIPSGLREVFQPVDFVDEEDLAVSDYRAMDESNDDDDYINAKLGE